MKHKHGYLIDMDGVIYHGSAAIEGASDFIALKNRDERAVVGLAAGNPARSSTPALRATSTHSASPR